MLNGHPCTGLYWHFYIYYLVLLVVMASSWFLWVVQDLIFSCTITIFVCGDWRFLDAFIDGFTPFLFNSSPSDLVRFCVWKCSTLTINFTRISSTGLTFICLLWARRFSFCLPWSELRSKDYTIWEKNTRFIIHCDAYITHYCPCKP